MDARKAKSRAAIVAAFSELLREEDYGKITVGDIIGRDLLAQGARHSTVSLRAKTTYCPNS